MLEILLSLADIGFALTQFSLHVGCVAPNFLSSAQLFLLEWIKSSSSIAVCHLCFLSSLSIARSRLAVTSLPLAHIHLAVFRIPS